MARSPLQALLDDGRTLAQLEERRAGLERDRDRLDADLAKLEGQVREATEALGRSLERFTEVVRKSGDPRAASRQALAAGKLPQRILAHMRANPKRMVSAPELASVLEVADVQQVRTALARMAKKALIRRTGIKGEYTM
jgi:hypothetical protein